MIGLLGCGAATCAVERAHAHSRESECRSDELPSWATQISPVIECRHHACHGGAVDGKRGLQDANERPAPILVRRERIETWGRVI
jgi:hypothetical protein